MPLDRHFTILKHYYFSYVYICAGSVGMCELECSAHGYQEMAPGPLVNCLMCILGSLEGHCVFLTTDLSLQIQVNNFYYLFVRL